MKTSESHPLRIDPVDAPGGGCLGLTFCPGKKQPDAATGPWDRDLDLDLDAVRDFGAAAVVTTMESWELEERVGVPAPRLEAGARARGMEWFHLPIADVHVPGDEFELRWLLAGPRIRRMLREGRRVVIHCRGGVGRTCTVSGRILVELGMDPAAALERVIEARPPGRYPMSDGQKLHVMSAAVAEEGPTARDRIVGSTIAGAVGDALGAPVEFLTLDGIRENYGPEGIRAYAPAFGVSPCAVTDDTQMAAFTAEGLIRGLLHESDPTPESLTRAVWRGYLRWHRTQSERYDPAAEADGWLLGLPALWSHRAPGKTCLGSLRGGRMGTVESALNDSAGCGGVMRVAAVGLLAPLLGGVEAAFRTGRDTAASTHGHPAGYLPAGYQAAAIGGLMSGATLEEAFEAADRLLDAEEERESVRPSLVEARRLLRGAKPGPETVEFLGEGWTGHEAIAISVYCALAEPDLEEALLLAVNHRGDTDSTGAITGNLVGAARGAGAVPPHLWQPLELLPDLLRLSRDLADLSAGRLDVREESVRRRYPGP